MSKVAAAPDIHYLRVFSGTQGARAWTRAIFLKSIGSNAVPASLGGSQNDKREHLSRATRFDIVAAFPRDHLDGEQCRTMYRTDSPL